MKQLFVWKISDTIVEYGTAIGFADSIEEAIEAIYSAIKVKNSEKK